MSATENTHKKKNQSILLIKWGSYILFLSLLIYISIGSGFTHKTIIDLFEDLRYLSSNSPPVHSHHFHFPSISLSHLSFKVMFLTVIVTLSLFVANYSSVIKEKRDVSRFFVFCFRSRILPHAWVCSRERFISLCVCVFLYVSLSLSCHCLARPQVSYYLTSGGGRPHHSVMMALYACHPPVTKQSVKIR